MARSIDDMNRIDEREFVDLLGGIFEHSPWVAELVYDERPFADRDSLYRAMTSAMQRAPKARRMDLLCAHPELAGKEAASGDLTAASKREQAGAGLDHCSAQELEKIRYFNRAYRERFGFPFIIAVSGLDRGQIIAAMETRLGNDIDTEFDTALGEVEKIARIRLDALIDD